MTKVLTDRDSDEAEELGNEQLRVVGWRMEWYIRTGYSKPNAGLLAHRDDIDHHFACKLLEKCNDEEQAMEILL
jgi:hypothetical protein